MLWRGWVAAGRWGSLAIGQPGRPRSGLAAGQEPPGEVGRAVAAKGRLMRIAAVTMSYNEPVWAGVWARHYAGQVGVEHCLVLDHGSDDGSADGLEVPVRRLARSPLDDAWRAAVVGDEVRRLLRRYDAVIHTDVDELLVADPARYSGLAEFAAAVAAPVVTAIGLDLHHLPDAEPALEVGPGARTAGAIGAQREWVRFSAAMCKPVLVRRAVEWAPGFHSCDAPMVLDRLYLVHLRYADLEAGLRRLARTRSQAVADPASCGHQRVSDAEFSAMMRAIAGLPRQEGTLDPSYAPLAGWLARLVASRAEREAEVYKLDLGLSGDALWRLPAGMRALI